MRLSSKFIHIEADRGNETLNRPDGVGECHVSVGH